MNITIAFALIFLCILGIAYSHSEGLLKKAIALFFIVILVTLALRIPTILDNFTHPIVTEKEKRIYESDFRKGGIVSWRGKDYCVDDLNEYDSIDKVTIYLSNEKDCE